MLPQPGVVIEAMKILISPGNSSILPPPLQQDNRGGGDGKVASAASNSDCDGLDLILENSLKDYLEKINTDLQFSCLNSFWSERKTRYFKPGVSLRWQFASACLVLIEALVTSLKEASTLEKQEEDAKKENPQSTKAAFCNKKQSSSKLKSVAPRLPADALSINQQKIFMNMMQFILCLGVYPHLAKGVGIPLERRSGFGIFLKSPSSQTDVKSVLERQFRLLLIARVFSACLKQTSLSSLFLSRYLGDCLAVMFQLCYGVKKVNVPKSDASAADNKLHPNNNATTTTTSLPVNNNNKKPNDTIQEENQVNITPLDIIPPIVNSVSANSSPSLSLNNNTDQTTTTTTLPVYHVAITQEDVEFCTKFLESLKKRSYPPSLVKELLLLQGGPSPKLNKALQPNPPGVTTDTGSNLNLPPAPAWMKNACSQALTRILLSKPNGVRHIVWGMLDAPVGTKTDSITEYQKYNTVARVISFRPPTISTDKEYWEQIAPQVIELVQDSRDEQYRQVLRVACCVMNIISIKNPCLFEKYFLKTLMSPLYSCVEFTRDRNAESGKILVDEFRLSACIEDVHRIFVCGLEPQAELLNQLQPFLHVIFSLFSYVDVTASRIRNLTDEILSTYLKSADMESAMKCLRAFVFGSLSKNQNLGIRLMHPFLTFAVGDNDCAKVVTKPESDADDEQLDLLCDESERTCSLLDLISKLDREELREKFLVYMLQELTRTLNEDSLPERTCEKRSSGQSSTELLDMELKQQENADQVFYQLTILNFLAAVFEKLGPSSLKSTKHVLEFIKSTLVKGVDELDPVEKEFGGIFNNEILTMSLGMLTAVVAGALEMTDDDQKTLIGFMPLLQNIIVTSNNSSIKAMASSLRVAIATYGKVGLGTDFADLKQNDCQAERFPLENKPRLVTELSDSSVAGEPSRGEANNIQNPKQKNDKPKKENKSLDISSVYKSHSVCSQVVPRSQDSFFKSPVTKPDDPFVGSLCTDKSKESLSFQPTNQKISRHSKLQDALKETYDPSVPVQGHGLITLTKLVQNDDKEAIKKQTLLQHIFEEKLTHPDSYIYLSAVNGLAVMAEKFPEKVVPRLLDLFRDPETEIPNGEAVPAEMKIKLGESIVKASRCLGATIPKYRDILLGAFLQGAKDEDPLVRASSLSNLGEACKLLHFSLGNVIHEIMSCCKVMVKSDPSVEVRAAAALLITQLLQGLGKDALKVLEFVMKDLYQLLKSIMVVEKEEQVRLHANLALNELDDIMRDLLFPKQSLTKRIRVLDLE